MPTGDFDYTIPPGFYKSVEGSIIMKTCNCGKTNEAVDSCKVCKPNKGTFGMTGWICPACGRGNSPHSSSCPCVPFPLFQVTCQGANSGENTNQPGL